MAQASLAIFTNIYALLSSRAFKSIYMRIFMPILVFLFLTLPTIAQKIESIQPLSLSNGDTTTAIRWTAQFDNTFVFLCKNKRHMYYGENISALNKMDLRDEFFKVFDTSEVKQEGELIHKIEAWEDELFFTNFYFLRVGEDIGLFADFVIEGFQYEYALSFHKRFIFVFDPKTLKGKKLLFLDLPTAEPQPIVRKVFSTPNTSSMPNLFADVEYEEETTKPVLIGLATSTSPAISFPNSFQLPQNNYRQVLQGQKFNYSTKIGNETQHFYSNGYEIIDMEKQEIFFASPDSTMILSPILFVENHPCVVVATINMEQMRNSNFRYVSVLDGSYIKDVDHRKLPSFYIHNLTGLSYSEQGPYLGFRNIEGKPHLIHFTP